MIKKNIIKNVYSLHIRRFLFLDERETRRWTEIAVEAKLPLKPNCRWIEIVTELNSPLNWNPS